MYNVEEDEKLSNYKYKKDIIYDFSLTQIPFTVNTFHSYVDNQESQSQEDREYLITCRKRVVQFVQKWVIAVRNAVFEDPVAVDFIEVIHCFNIERWQILQQRNIFFFVFEI